MNQLIPLLAAATAVGWLFDAAGVPVGWLLGPLSVGVAASWWNDGPRPLPPGYMVIGQAVLGLGIGVSFPLHTLRTASAFALPLLAAVVITGALSLLNGYLLWRWAGVDRATGFMGSLPGAASSIVAMSDDMGADAVTVAVLQYLRLMLVIFVAPVAVRALFQPGTAGAPSVPVTLSAPLAPALLNLPVLLLAGTAGAVGGRLLRVPSPAFVGPVLVGLLVSWTAPYSFRVPDAVFAAGLLLVGLSIGARFDVVLARKLGRAAVIEAVLVLALIGVCLGIGYGFHAVTGIDAMTAVLGSTPGGMDVMVASAAELGGDPGLVLAMQMTRWFAVLLAGPWVAVRLVRRTEEAAAD